MVAGIEAEDLVAVLAHPGTLDLQGANSLLASLDLVVSIRDVFGDVRGVDQEALEVLQEHRLEIINPDLPAALVADVFPRLRWYVHLLAAAAGHDACEERHRGTTAPCLLALAPLVEDRIALIPYLFGHDRLDRDQDPVGLGLHVPLLALTSGTSVVRAAHPLGGPVPHEPDNSRVRKLRAVSGAVPPFVEDSRYCLLPPRFEEKLVDEPPDRCLGWVRHELAILPAVAEWRGTAEGLSHLGTNRDRGRNPFSDLLALPLRHGRDHGVEEAAGGGGRVDRFVEGHEVGIVFAKPVGEVEQLAGIAREAGEFREDECRDMPCGYVPEHPLRFRMTDYGLSAHGIEAIHLANVPALDFGVRPGTTLVVLGTLALHLVFG